MQRKVHTIDATGKTLGRLASQIAILLRGKHKVDYELHLDNGDFVKVANVDKMKFTGKKINQKIYYRHSGHVGGIKQTPLKQLVAKNPEKLLKMAVYNMIPCNKLRSRIIKRLQFIK